MQPTLGERIERIAWGRVEAQLDALGHATPGPLLTAEECRTLAGMYGEAARFRSRIVMRRHTFGEGEYQYFARPLPEIVAELRRLVYPRLVPIANRWQKALGLAPELSGRARRIPRDLSRGRPDAADAAAPANTGPATTTVCTRISTASCISRSRWRSC